MQRQAEAQRQFAQRPVAQPRAEARPAEQSRPAPQARQAPPSPPPQQHADDRRGRPGADPRR
jgi:hypothetical protein